MWFFLCSELTCSQQMCLVMAMLSNKQSCAQRAQGCPVVQWVQPMEQLCSRSHLTALAGGGVVLGLHGMWTRHPPVLDMDISLFQPCWWMLAGAGLWCPW